ncbi:hypothetical protein QBC41DRAFT_378986 [Cercophora samala]|uniref:Uncharacterized protein n=1 Tax=Cercophora samala TaxID=330535 RepID=A0AA39Z7K0_9PEZI|nr:hypothetical protein QBC41DRAFT_378986 [Cercophora samala]
MLFASLLLFPILGWAMQALVFHPAGNCWVTDDTTISCRNISERTCCMVTGPFCGVLNCENCPVGSIVNTYFEHACSADADSWCKVTHPFDNKGGCCVDLGLAETCSGMWWDPSATAVSAASERNCVEPNHMTYVDHDHGVKREIHIPQGELERATRLLLARNFTALGMFKDWADQSSNE